jgi:hypothetical protein
MSDGFATGFGAGAGARAHERADDEKTTLQQAERWATLVGAQLSALALKLDVEPEAGAWHSGAGDLTPAGLGLSSEPGATPVAGVGREGASDAQENRMVVRVDGGDLGEVALVLDRNAGAIRVTISAADAGAEAALGLERAALVRALEGHGISVESVSVVRADNFGTVLAPPRPSAQRTREVPVSGADSKDDEQTRRRLARKLNLIG